MTRERPKMPLWAFVTAVDEAIRYAPGDLNSFHFDKAKDKLGSTLLAAGLGKLTIVGGIDFSFNVDDEGRWPDHWCPHFSLLAFGMSPERVTTSLTPFFAASISVPKPIMAEEIADPLGLATYLVKSSYFRRSSFLARNGRYKSYNFSLKPVQEHELTLFLDQHQPVDRLFLQNICIRGAELVRVRSSKA